MIDEEEGDEEDEEEEVTKYICKKCRKTFYEDEEHDFCKDCWPTLSFSDKLNYKQKPSLDPTHSKRKKYNKLKAFFGGELNA